MKLLKSFFYYLSKHLVVFSVALSLIFLVYLYKTYNPTSFSWQTELTSRLFKLTDLAFWPYLFKSSPLPIYELELAPNNYVALNQSLPPRSTKVLRKQYKTQYVPGTLKFQGKEYNVEVRYRGVDFDHWTRPKKSWRIKFDADKPFFGQTAINLIIPEDRGVYLEELSNYRAKKLGLIVPDSQFVVLKVNGQTQGVYWQVEQWSPAFLERHQLPLGNLYGEDDEALFRLETQPFFLSVKYWTKYTQDETYSEDNYAELAQFLDLINNADDQEFFKRLPFLLDMDNFLNWQAHTVLMGSTHQDATHNFRVYWHPVLGKFMIFPWDVSGGYGWPVAYHPLVSRVLKNPVWLEKRNQILADYVTDPDNLTQDLAYYDQLVNQTKVAIFKDYKKFFSNFGYLQQSKKTRQQIIDQFNLIKSDLENKTIPNETQGFDLPAQTRVDVSDASKTILPAEFQDFEKNFQNNPKLIYGPGAYYINQTIIIPSGHTLRLLPGARLLFAPGVSLLSYSQVIATQATLTAQDPQKPWGVFAVVGEAASQSQFDQVIIEHGKDAVINGTYFTGALAFHKAQNTIVKNSIFRDNHGDDALNIKYDSQPSILNNQFIDNEFDGLDLDFCQGEVRNNRVINSGNDGFDFGSASPLVIDNLIDTAVDKCISLGETSDAKISNNTLKHCNMGIAVKDSSQPEIINNQIINNNIGLASYQKKPIFPRRPFVFKDNDLSNNKIDFQEDDPSLRKDQL